MPNDANEGSSPRHVATIGLHGSASTWVFNAVRELLSCAFGAESVLAVYADEAHELPDGVALGQRHQGHRLLRYEDRFFDDSRVLAQLSAQITPAVTPQTQSVLFERYRSESVREFAAALGSLPPARLIVSERMKYDRLTHIHRGHIGDTRSGKWRELSPHQRAETTQLFEPFLRSFGYETDSS